MNLKMKWKQRAINKAVRVYDIADEVDGALNGVSEEPTAQEARVYVQDLRRATNNLIRTIAEISEQEIP